MRRIQWRWWWCVCLVTPAVFITLPGSAAAAGQGQCEVLDPSLTSTYSLPTNITVKPTTQDWTLDFALREGDAPPTACIRIERKHSEVRLKFYKRECEAGDLMDYNYLSDKSVLDNTWTLLDVEVKTNTVSVTGLDGEPVTLKANNSSLPCDTLYVTMTKYIEVAVGCRINCPHYKHYSEQDKKKNMLTSSTNIAHFYFRPGNNFVKLQYEVTYTSPQGITKFLHITDIVSPEHLPNDSWHLVELQHLHGIAEVHLDYTFLKQEQLPSGCTFIQHTVRMIGDTLFSLTCNPSRWVAGCIEDIACQSLKLKYNNCKKLLMISLAVIAIQIVIYSTDLHLLYVIRHNFMNLFIVEEV